MPVEDEDLGAAALRYAALLPDRLDLVHLGLGPDHGVARAELRALAVRDRDVVMSREYNGRRRMTLTYPAIDRAQGAVGRDRRSKAEALAQLLSGDEEIPAARSARRCRQS